MPRKKDQKLVEIFDSFLEEGPSHRDQQIDELQKNLEFERDARREERFIFIVIVTVLLDVVLFSVLDGLGGPIALLILELLILIPLARRMGMDEIAQLLDRVLHRVAGSFSKDE